MIGWGEKAARKHGSKTCKVCAEIFHRPAGISDKVWDKRDCCGRVCSNIIRRKPEVEPRTLKRRADYDIYFRVA